MVSTKDDIARRRAINQVLTNQMLQQPQINTVGGTAARLVGALVASKMNKGILGDENEMKSSQGAKQNQTLFGQHPSQDANAQMSNAQNSGDQDSQQELLNSMNQPQQQHQDDPYASAVQQQESMTPAQPIQQAAQPPSNQDMTQGSPSQSMFGIPPEIKKKSDQQNILDEEHPPERKLSDYSQDDFKKIISPLLLSGDSDLIDQGMRLADMYSQEKIKTALSSTAQKERDERSEQEDLLKSQRTSEQQERQFELENKKFEQAQQNADRNYEVAAQKNQIALQRNDITQKQFEQKQQELLDNKNQPDIKASNDLAASAIKSNEAIQRMKSLTKKISPLAHNTTGAIPFTGGSLDTSANREFESLANQMTIANRPAGMPVRTNFELQFLKSMAPNINDGQQVINRKLENQEAINENDIQGARFINDQAKKGIKTSDAKQELIEYEQKYPIVTQDQYGNAVINKKRPTIEQFLAEKRLEGGQ